MPYWPPALTTPGCTLHLNRSVCYMYIFHTFWILYTLFISNQFACCKSYTHHAYRNCKCVIVLFIYLYTGCIHKNTVYESLRPLATINPALYEPASPRPDTQTRVSPTPPALSAERRGKNLPNPFATLRQIFLLTRWQKIHGAFHDFAKWWSTSIVSHDVGSFFGWGELFGRDVLDDVLSGMRRPAGEWVLPWVYNVQMCTW